MFSTTLSHIRAKMSLAVHELLAPHVHGEDNAIVSAYVQFSMAIRPDTDLLDDRANACRDRIYELTAPALEEGRDVRTVVPGMKPAQRAEFARRMLEIYTYVMDSKHEPD